jgi:hypothetical protein
MDRVNIAKIYIEKKYALKKDSEKERKKGKLNNKLRMGRFL